MLPKINYGKVKTGSLKVVVYENQKKVFKSKGTGDAIKKDLETFLQYKD